VPRVAALTRDDVQAAATRNLRPDDLVAVVVGDAARVSPTLEPLGLGEPKLTAVV
jgi:predicted Zn-dependent peptidase